MNLKYLPAFIFIVYAIGCGNPTKPENTAIASVQADATDNIPASALLADTLFENEEYIDWNSAKINGEISTLTTTGQLYKLLGQPDSLVTPDPDDICGTYFDSDFQEAYFGSSAFEIHGDTAVISMINFRTAPRITLTIDSLRLNSATQLSEIQTTFPAAWSSRYQLNVHEIGRVTAIRIAISKMPTDDSWLLFFQEDKLVRIDYYIPC